MEKGESKTTGAIFESRIIRAAMSYSLEDFDDTKFLDFVRGLYLDNMAMQDVLSEVEGYSEAVLQRARLKYQALVAERFAVFYAGANKDQSARQALLSAFVAQEKKQTDN